MLKRNKFVRIEFLLSVGIVLLFIFAVIRFVVFGWLFQEHKSSDLDSEKRTEFIYLADELRQTSNSLTLLARNYVVTGDTIHRNQYFDIIKVRNGQMNRPKSFNLVYWDRLSKLGIKTTSSDGKPLSLLQIAQNIGVEGEELKILKRTKELSDSLSVFEQKAFALMEGRSLSANAQGKYERKPDQNAAINMLFGNEYLFFKAPILEGVNDFHTAVNNRIQTNENKHNKTINDAISWLLLLGILTSISFIVVVYSHLRIKKNAAEAYRAIEEYSSSLAEMNASKTKFFSIIAHDLRSPFIGFLGLTQMLAEETCQLSAEEVKEFSTAMKKSAENLNELLENLLEWANLEGGMTTFVPEKLDVLQVAQKNVDLHRDFALKKDITILNTIADETLVLADKRMINVLFRNLISNAIKFTPKGGLIEIGVQRNTEAGQFHTIFVRDNGMGMSQKTLENIFKISTKTSGLGTEGEKGTGLGLILCQEFVKKSNGDIWIESEPGKGSTFYFTLPVYRN